MNAFDTVSVINATTATNSQDELETMLVDVLNREAKLTDWELNFIDSISINIEANTGLSESQDETFTRIWMRVTDMDSNP